MVTGLMPDWPATGRAPQFSRNIGQQYGDMPVSVAKNSCGALRRPSIARTVRIFCKLGGRTISFFLLLNGCIQTQRAAGHWVQLDAPKVVNDALERFLLAV